ncbi:MAG: type II toxin-antitoxin system VapC family toxin [Acidobacteria bacterium]|nr:type II toxin-antitoxin system VapC family toxin [Acidobacteriota bacterium]
MKKLFVDTSGWANLAYSSEPFHDQAVQAYSSALSDNVRLITTNYVIAELVPLLTSVLKIPRPRIIEFINSIKGSAHFEIVHIDGDLDTLAWKHLEARSDKNWSLVDASSFVLMQELGMTEAMTTDHHFEQAGFVRLLK